MAQDYIAKEVDKIIKEEGHPFPKNIALASAWLMGNFKGINLKILDVKKTSSLSDYFVIASASNITQAKAMANEILVQLKRHGHKALSHEGREGADWILLDLGDILVHIFLESSRSVYDLEGLWKNATPVEIPQSYYFSSDDSSDQASSKSDKSYF